MKQIKIKKKHHFRNFLSDIFPRISFSKRMETEYYVQFDHSCKYLLDSNKTQVNKLLGIGHIHHHLNSVRLGWRYVEDLDKIELLPYYYENGKRIIVKNDQFPERKLYINCGETVKVKFIYAFNNNLNYVQGCIYINDNLYDINLWFNNNDYIKGLPFLYECFPYFGGSVPSPHDMTIYIERIK